MRVPAWDFSPLRVRLILAMTIVSVSYPLFPVTPDSAGGAEQVLYLLDRQIVDAGHTSIVIAARGSKVSGTLYETPAADGLIDDAVKSSAIATHRKAIAQVLREHAVDLIHFHGLDFQHYLLPELSVPAIATIHLPLDWYPSSPLQSAVFPVCVSHAQAGDSGCRVIANGIDTARFQFVREADGYLLWLGRICPEKGTDIAICVAQACGKRLVIAGPVHPFEWHRNYFESGVAPFLRDGVEYVGAVGGSKKEELLAGATALLIPSLAAETSSLIAMEALSSGTPVIAFGNGALPEVVENGLTGYIVQSEQEMAEAVHDVSQISRETCRAEAIRRFDFRRMGEQYLSLYAERLVTPELAEA
jgi:glycosyltransferase involved in cell wall biosynthesis